MQETSHFSHLDASKSFCLSMNTIFVPNLYLLLRTKDPPHPQQQQQHIFQNHAQSVPILSDIFFAEGQNLVYV